MKKTVKITLLIFLSVIVILTAAVAYLLTPSLWTGTLDDYFNANPEWDVTFTDISGHLLTTTTVSNIEIIKSDSTQVIRIPEVVFNINPLPLIFSELSLSRLKIRDFEFDYSAADSLGQSKKINPLKTSSLISNLYIRNLTANGVGRIKGIENSPAEISLNYDGRFKYRPSGSFLHINSLAYSDDQNNDLTITNSGIQIYPGRIQLKSLAGVYNEQEFQLTLNGSGEQLPFDNFEGRLDLKSIEIPADSSFWTVVDSSWKKVDVTLDYRTDLETIEASFSVNAQNDTINGNFQALRKDDYVQLEALDILLGKSRVHGNGVYENSGRLAGRLDISSINLDDILAETLTTDLSGMVLVESIISESNIEKLWLSFELIEENLLPGEPISISSTLTLQDSIIIIDNPLVIYTETGSCSIAGSYYRYNKYSDISLDCSDLDITMFNQLIASPIELGKISGSMDLVGTPDSLIWSIDATGRNILFEGIRAGEIKFKSDITNPFVLPGGSLLIDLKDGEWKRYKFKQGTADLFLDSSFVKLNSVNLKDDDNFIQLSGKFDPAGSLHFDQIRLGYNLHYYINSGPIDLSWNNSDFSIKPFILHVDDGIMEGFANFGDYREGRIKFSNISAESILNHVEKKSLGLKGLLFGEIAVYGERNQESVEVELSMKNGQIINQQFDDMVVSSLFHDSILHIDEFTLIKGEDTGIQLSGVLPQGKRKDQSVGIELISELRNIDIGVLKQFLPKFPHLDGSISGEFDLTGLTSKLNFSYDLTIDNAVYDRVQLGTVNGTGEYHDKRIFFSILDSKYKGNHLTGNGSLPIDFDIASENFGRFIKGTPLSLNVSAKTRSLDFLSVYLNQADSLTGDFDLQLSLSGVFENIIRNGYFKVNGGKIYTTLLDNTIENINGSLLLTDNMMRIDKFVGSLIPSQQFSRRVSIKSVITGQSISSKNNLSISGLMDMTKFFKPRFDLQVNADDAYIRTLLGDIEGLVDVDITMTGRDTVTYSGTITPINVEMRKEFVPPEIDESEYQRGKTMTVYKLTFPITGEFKLINTQLDADLRGELSLIRYGRQEADYAGELFIRGGKFYYTGDVFTIDEGGSMIFNGKGFNGDIDIQASTTISEYKITATLNGPIDNPTLAFESEPFLSQTDILSLLTIRTRFGEEDFASEGFGQISGTILGAWFEQQLEKNLSQVSRELGLVDEVNISGTSGLIDNTNPEDMTISAQRQLSTKLALNYSYKRSFSLTNPNQQLVGVEYKLNRYLSLVGNYDDAGNLQVKYRLRYSY